MNRWEKQAARAAIPALANIFTKQSMISETDFDRILKPAIDNYAAKTTGKPLNDMAPNRQRATGLDANTIQHQNDLKSAAEARKEAKIAAGIKELEDRGRTKMKTKRSENDDARNEDDEPPKKKQFRAVKCSDPACFSKTTKTDVFVSADAASASANNNPPWYKCDVDVACKHVFCPDHAKAAQSHGRTHAANVAARAEAAAAKRRKSPRRRRRPPRRTNRLPSSDLTGGLPMQR